MINRYKRVARTVAELGLGTLTPLIEAMPEAAAAMRLSKRLQKEGPPVGGESKTSVNSAERARFELAGRLPAHMISRPIGLRGDGGTLRLVAVSTEDAAQGGVVEQHSEPSVREPGKGTNAVAAASAAEARVPRPGAVVSDADGARSVLRLSLDGHLFRATPCRRTCGVSHLG